MKKPGLCMALACLSLMALLAGCGGTADNPGFAYAGNDVGGSLENDMVIIGGGDGIMGQYPGDDQGEYEEPEQTEPTDPPVVMVDLPDGTRVPEEEVQTLEDGTIVVGTDSVPTGHKCFFPDGTYALTQYFKGEEGDFCVYAEADELFVQWYFSSGALWKDEYYIVKSNGTLFLSSGGELEYTQLEIGNEDSPLYHSATVHRWYDESEGKYLTGRMEFDPYHGSEKPIKQINFDGSWSEHEYNADGSQKKATYYSPDGQKTQMEFYENDQVITKYSFRADGSQSFVTHYQNGIVTSQDYYSEYYSDTTYYENGCPVFTQGRYDDGRVSSAYYDESGCVVKEVYNKADGELDWYVLYEHYSNGNTKKATYYDGNNQVTQVEEYDENGNLIQ